MLGMTFTSFLTLLVVSAVVAATYDWILRYRFLEGIHSFLAKVPVGWVGGWLGSPVLGHWLWNIQSVYIVPAILGAIAAIHLNVLCWKASAKLSALERCRRGNPAEAGSIEQLGCSATGG